MNPKRTMSPTSPQRPTTMMVAALTFVAIVLATYLALGALAQQPLPLDLQKRNSTGCLPRFHSVPVHFEKCKKNICFLFISETPFIVLDPDMEKQNNQTLFRCRDLAKVFPGLSGISFRIKDQLPLANSLCVFAGTQCTFNNMMDFVAEHSTFNEGYQFAVSALMFLLPTRISNRTIPTVPIMEGKMVILGPRDPPTRTREVIGTIFQPFHLDAWILLGGILMLLVILSIAKFCFSTGDRSFYNYVRSLFGDDVSDTISVPQTGRELSLQEQEWWRGLRDESRVVNKVAGTTLGLALAAFLTISILCYEIAIVNFAFVQRVKQLGKDVQSLTPRELSKYMVMANAAEEKFWRTIVDPEDRYARDHVPWRRCGNVEDCFRKLLDRNHPAIYFLTYDFNVRYHLHELKLCKTHTAYTTKRPLFLFNWGWYFGANVPAHVRVQVNRAITTLRLEDKMRQIFSKAADTPDRLDCGNPNRSIGVEIVGPMVALVVGVFLLVLCAALVRGCIIRSMARRGYKQAVVEDT